MAMELIMRAKATMSGRNKRMKFRKVAVVSGSIAKKRRVVLRMGDVKGNERVPERSYCLIVCFYN